MNIIAILHGEHRVLLKLFDWTEDIIAAKFDMGIASETGKMVSRLLISHSRQEENVLFDALEPLLGNIGPMAVMIHRAAHREIAKKFGEALAVTPVDVAALKEAIKMCRSHFRGEETVLFPLAKRVLDPGELNRLGARLLEEGVQAGNDNV